MAACRLAAKGRSLADSSYDAEVRSILAFLQLQHPAPAPAINPQSLDINPEDYAAPRFVRKLKSKVSWLSPGFILQREFNSDMYLFVTNFCFHSLCRGSWKLMQMWKTYLWLRPSWTTSRLGNHYPNMAFLCSSSRWWVTRRRSCWV